MQESLSLLKPLLPWSKTERMAHVHTHLPAISEEAEAIPPASRSGTQGLEQPLLVTLSPAGSGHEAMHTGHLFRKL